MASYFCLFGSHITGTQGLLLVLFQGSLLAVVRGPYVGPRIKIEIAAICKTSALHISLYLVLKVLDDF